MPRGKTEPRVIPVALLEPYVEEWLDRNTKPRENLARIMRISASDTKRILDGPLLTFTQTDKLLTAIERIDLWHGVLADYYTGIAA